jgi:DNA-binding IscR family transcriptional regulator
VIRAVDGPLGAVAGRAPETVAYGGAAARVQDTWVALRASVRNVLESVTLADIAADRLPSEVTSLLADPGAWSRR